jgi:hypothetical protein
MNCFLLTNLSLLFGFSLASNHFLLPTTTVSDFFFCFCFDLAGTPDATNPFSGFLPSESYTTTDGQSASLSWNKAPIWGLRPDFYFC